jgi:hypothetical protein
MMDGQQPDPTQLPPVGEPLRMATGQLRGLGTGVLVLVTFAGPGRTFTGILDGEDAANWGSQLKQVGEMSKAGLFIDTKGN